MWYSCFTRMTLRRVSRAVNVVPCARHGLFAIAGHASLHLCAQSFCKCRILSFTSAVSCASGSTGFDFLGAKFNSVCTVCRFRPEVLARVTDSRWCTRSWVRFKAGNLFDRCKRITSRSELRRLWTLWNPRVGANSPQRWSVVLVSSPNIAHFQRLHACYCHRDGCYPSITQRVCYL
jgi:hypothetical protein